MKVGIELQGNYGVPFSKSHHENGLPFWGIQEQLLREGSSVSIVCADFAFYDTMQSIFFPLIATTER